MIVQLNPSIPVTVTSKDNRPGECIAMIDYGPEHHIMWGVAFDDTGEVWWTPNPEIRLHPNWSLERRFKRRTGLWQRAEGHQA